MAIDKKIIKVSELPQLNRVFAGMKTISAIDRKNYLIDLMKIKGRRITDITGDYSKESGGQNAIHIKFDDGKESSIYYYNGTDGNKGKPGYDGGKGPQGTSGTDNINSNLTGIKDIATIVNSSERYDNLTEEQLNEWANAALSAYRGKTIYDLLYNLNETFITEELFNLLFLETKEIYAEFVTTNENQNVKIFNTDTNKHTRYFKYWTFEDDNVVTYYIYNPVSDIYEPVDVDLWKDIYLRDENKEYYEATNTQLFDGTELYYYDEKTESYQPVVLIQTETTDENGLPVIQYNGDKAFDWYSSHIDATIHVRYFRSGDKYTYKLNDVTEIPIYAYLRKGADNYERVRIVEIDGSYYEIDSNTTITDGVVYDENGDPKDSIDMNALSNYWEKTTVDGVDSYSMIENLLQYVTRDPVRYYTKQGDRFVEKASLDEIDVNNFEEYLVETIDTTTNTYTYEYLHTITLYKGTANEETKYVNNTLVLKNGTIKLYVKDEDRTYYNRIIETNNKGETIVTYVPISKLSWIYAEFITKDEDVKVKLLNSRTSMEESNEEIDTTDDSYYEEHEVIGVERIVPGDKEFYSYNQITSNYDLVDLSKDSINQATTYYQKTDRVEYIQITGEYAIDNDLVEIYFINDDEQYELNKTTIIPEATYYLRKEIYSEIDDIDSFLSIEDLNLIIGVPQLLPINIYPLNCNDNRLVIEYDPDKITLYEDGSICAVDNSAARQAGVDYEPTKLLLSTVDGDVTAVINVNLIIPVKTVEFTIDDNVFAEYEINNNTELVLKVKYTPEIVSYDTFDWEVEGVDYEVSSDTKSITLRPTNQGEYTIKVKSTDVNKEEAEFKLTVVEPAISFGPNTESLKHVIEYYTYDEAYVINQELQTQLNNNEITEEEYYERYINSEFEDNPTIKSDYYLYNCLMGKDYEILDLVTVEPEDTTYKDVTFTSSNTDICVVIPVMKDVEITPAITYEATIDDINNNLATEVGELITIPAVTERREVYVLRTYRAGDAEITGYLTNYPDAGEVSIRIHVNQAVESIEIYPSNTQLNIGETKIFKAVVTPSTSVDSRIRWEVTGSGEVSMSEINESDPFTMPITGVAGGPVVIDVYALDGSGTNTKDLGTSSNVKVTIPAKDIYLYKDNTRINDIMYIGIGEANAKNIFYEITYTLGNTDSTNTSGIEWSSENPEIATVTDGRVVGRAIGRTTIIGYAGDSTGVFGSIVVEVIKLNESISFGSLQTVEMEVNDTLVLVPEFTPADSSNQVLIWESTDETVAKVKSSGIVYGLKQGSATIKATTTDGTNLTAECKLTVI